MHQRVIVDTDTAGIATKLFSAFLIALVCCVHGYVC